MKKQLNAPSANNEKTNNLENSSEITKTKTGKGAVSGLTGADTKTNKRSTSETGHAKNIANLHELIAFIESYGVKYNPNKQSLKLEELVALKVASMGTLEDVIHKTVSYNNVVNDRVITFNRLNEFATRLINALETSEAPKEKVKNAKSFIRKLRGQRAGKIDSLVDKDTPAPVNISVSQRSYNQQIQHFSGLLAILESEGSYKPNETDLQIVSLTAKKASLIASNNAVPVAHAEVTVSRNNRDTVLYMEHSGLVDIALEVKKYIKAAFGASSMEYKNIKGIAFKNVK